MRLAPAWVLVLFSVASVAAPLDNDHIARETADEYLRAATGEGSANGKQLLLGGITMGADLLQLENAQIVSGEPVRHEESSMESALAHVEALDKAARQALGKLLGNAGNSDDLSVKELTKEQAAQLLAPTKDRANRFLQDHPVLAYAIRVDKEVYWHPKNPMRAVLHKAGKKGTYSLDLYLFRVASLEGPNKFRREWPLRVLRFKSGKVDTGWRVLPASDWTPE
jgi:hypothetical protein